MTKKKEFSQIIVIKPDGTHIPTQINKLSLERAQELVGGYVERVPGFDMFEGQSCVVLCNEEGKIKQQPTNVRATLSWYECDGVSRSDMLVGDVVVVLGQARKGWG